MIKISPYKDGLIRLRLKRNGQWKEYTTRYQATDKQLIEINDIAQEIANHKDRGAELSFELRERVRREIGETKVREIFVKANLLPSAVKKDTSVAAIKAALFDRLKKRTEKGELTADSQFKRQNVLNKFEEFLTVVYPDLNDVRDLETSHGRKFVDYLLYDRIDVATGKKRTVAKNTAQNEKKWLSQMFDGLVENGDIPKNPFSGIRTEGEKSDKSRVTVPYVVLMWIEGHLRVWKNVERGWYIYYMLTRWLGSRKNEALHLKWKDVLFKDMKGMGAINMPAPKTKKTGKSYRRCPMMNTTKRGYVDCGLRQALQEEYERQNPSPEDYVVQGILNLHKTKRDDVVWKNKNPSTTFEKLVIQCGFAPWRKLIQNLRVTRENELTLYSGWRAEAVHQIIGHSRQSYERNYANVTDDDFIEPPRPRYETQVTEWNEELQVANSPDYSPYFTVTGLEFAKKRADKLRKSGEFLTTEEFRGRNQR